MGRRKNSGAKLPNEKGEWRCSKCEQWLPPSSYSKNKAQVNGLNYACKDCMRAKTRSYNLVSKYGLPVEEFHKMLDAQEHKCLCCDQDLILGSEVQQERPMVDHCHATGRVRGCLCDRCNKLVGLLQEDFAYTQKLATYIHENC